MQGGATLSEPDSGTVPRREMLKRAAVVGSVGLWAPPVIEAFVARAAATSVPPDTAPAPPSRTTYDAAGTYTYDTQGYTIFAVTLVGGGGAEGGNDEERDGYGTGGSTVEGTLTVPPGTSTLTVVVGQGGQFGDGGTGFGEGGNGGPGPGIPYIAGAGGGGGTAILVNGLPVLVAGGGGGGGAFATSSGGVGGETTHDGGDGAAAEYLGAGPLGSPEFAPGGGGGGGGYLGGAGGGPTFLSDALEHGNSGASGTSLATGLPTGFAFFGSVAVGTYGTGNAGADPGYPHYTKGGDGSVVITQVS